MTDPYSDYRKRLWNWGRWGRLNPDAPDGSCANPMYDLMTERADGWGDTQDVLTRVPGVEPGAELPAIDEYDAEVIDCWVRQIWGAHRRVLVSHYVLRNDQSRECVDAAIRAIWDLQERNWASNTEMRKRLR